MTLKSRDKWEISSSTEACIAYISNWMMKLNKDNTKYIVFSSKQLVKENDILRIKKGSSYINDTMSEQSIGLILDNTLGMEKQLKSKAMSCYYQIRVNLQEKQL